MPRPLTLVGLSGGVKVGKDTLAQKYFANAGFRSVAFADPLKARVVGTGMASYEDLYLTKSPAHRKLLTDEGNTNGWMKYGQQLWCRTLYAQLQTIADRWGKDFTRYVITDVRFPHEVDFIHELGGVVYRIEAPARYAANGLTDEARADISERALDGKEALFDGFIRNDPEDAPTVGGQVFGLLKAHNLLPPMGRFMTGIDPFDLFLRS